ncbi:hypothetical protein AX16_000181 [Volvariella volvacea WC 439]|nr:hypothetical protein AX16_000181 [Volvariella volvacea WC 439]
MPVTFAVDNANPEAVRASSIKSEGAPDFLSKPHYSNGQAPVEEFISSFAEMVYTPPFSGNPDTVLQSCQRGFMTSGSAFWARQAHAEEMRYQLVSHEGQKELAVVRNGDRFSADWPETISEFGVKMQEHLKDDMIAEWLAPAFSTTTLTNIVAANISVMATMRNYFKYSVLFGCGIPSITLQGTKEDWVGLRSTVDRLAELGQ